MAERPEEGHEGQEAWQDALAGECPGQEGAPEWEPEEWPEDLAGPEYWFYKNGLYRRKKDGEEG
jgi:hypothetical protein